MYILDLSCECGVCKKRIELLKKLLESGDTKILMDVTITKDDMYIYITDVKKYTEKDRPKTYGESWSNR